MSFLECLSGAVAGGLNPDFTILLDVDPRIGLSRIGDKRKHRIEKEPVAFHESVRQGYLAQARKHPDRIIVVDAAMPIDVVFQKVWSELENCFSKV